jgi:CheY-like chemotaxis protein
VDLEADAEMPRLSVEKEIALFRVAQEGLTNVLRHSGSAKAHIRLVVKAGELELTVEDEGQGVKGRKAGTLEIESGFGVGIPGMRERLNQFDGSLELLRLKTGTRLTARIPLGKVSTPATAIETVRASQETQSQLPTTNRSSARKRILIADDHEVARRGIKTLVAEEADMEICGEAKDGLEAISKTKELQPDLVVMDLSMPGVGGLTAGQHIRAAGIPTKLLAFSSHGYPGIERVLLAAGFEGLVQKMNAGGDLIAGMRAVLGGNRFYDSHIVPTAKI